MRPRAALAASLFTVACSGNAPPPADPPPAPTATPTTTASTAAITAPPSATATATAAPSGAPSAEAAAPPAMLPDLDEASVPAVLRAPAASDAPGAGKDRYGDSLPAGAVGRLGTLRYRVLHGSLNQRVLSFTAQGGLRIAQRVAYAPAIRDAVTGKVVTRIQGSPYSASSFAVSPDGKLAAFSCNVIDVVDPKTGKSVQTLSIPRDPSLRGGGAMAFTGEQYLSTCVTFSGDGATAIASMDAGVNVWNVHTGKVVAKLGGPCGSTLTSGVVAISKNGAVAGCASSGVRLWDARTGARLASLPGHRAKSLALSDDGKTAVTGEVGAIALWNVADGSLIKRIPSMPGATYAVAISSDGKLVAASTEHSVRAFDVATGRPVPVPPGHEGEVHDVAFSSDGKRVATAGWDGRVLVWDAATGKVLHVVEDEPGRVSALAWSKKGALLAVGRNVPTGSTYASTLRLYDASTFALTRAVSLTGYTDAIDIAPDETFLAVAGTEGALRFVSAKDGAVLRSAPWTLSRSRSVALSPDGAVAFVGMPYSTAPVRAFSTAKPTGGSSSFDDAERPLREYVEQVVAAAPSSSPLDALLGGGAPSTPPDPGHEAGVHDIAASPNGKYLVTAARSGGVFVWGLASAKVFRCWATSAEAVAFDPTRQRVVLGGASPQVAIYAVDAGGVPSGPCTNAKTNGARSKPTGTEHTGHDDAVNDVAVSPDGKLIASASDDGTVLLWPSPP